MNILFATTHPHKPYFFGGSEQSSHELINELKSLNHSGAVLSSRPHKPGLRSIRYLARSIVNNRLAYDLENGYRTYRSWNPKSDILDVFSNFRADAVVIQAGDQESLAKETINRELPTLIYLRDSAFSDFSYTVLDNATFIANSNDTRKKFQHSFGIDSIVIPPLIRSDSYITDTSRHEILFVNVHPEKGIDYALSIAEKCPDIPFTFLMGWGFHGPGSKEIFDRIAACPNINLLPQQKDMRAVYARAKLLLVPTATPYLGQLLNVSEAWGRVVSEAQMSGIPAIASDIGGLPELVGTGGILLDRTLPVDDWVTAIRKIWDDDDGYADLSREALAHARRPEFQPPQLAAKFAKIALEAIS